MADGHRDVGRYTLQQAMTFYQYSEIRRANQALNQLIMIRLAVNGDADTFKAAVEEWQRSAQN